MTKENRFKMAKVQYELGNMTHPHVKELLAALEPPEIQEEIKPKRNKKSQK